MFFILLFRGSGLRVELAAVLVSWRYDLDIFDEHDFDLLGNGQDGFRDLSHISYRFTVLSFLTIGEREDG